MSAHCVKIVDVLGPHRVPVILHNFVIAMRTNIGDLALRQLGTQVSRRKCTPVSQAHGHNHMAIIVFTYSEHPG